MSGGAVVHSLLDGEILKGFGRQIAMDRAAKRETLKQFMHRNGATLEEIHALLAAGVVDIHVERVLVSDSIKVILVLGNNRWYMVGGVIHSTTGWQVPSLSWGDAIGPCILLASLPPVDSKEKP